MASVYADRWYQQQVSMSIGETDPIYSEYAGFFGNGMVNRDARNAIIQHGTKTIVRRTTLDQIHAWSTWCITEDAELGLRILEHGYRAAYIPKSYGRGLMPDNFLDFKKQRFR
ncbi:MAG: cellulose synthase/poly-beta-1,6-N-acetylglucosamine synthase-like glycosyltransferase [Granulosicoccus sp.]|jgi:cellulose synthase/poly-beta-1,6-N-acetylglucosamine synthase-like glycosyltransferase